MAKEEISVVESGLLAEMNQNPHNIAHVKAIGARLAATGHSVRLNRQTDRWEFMRPKED